MKRAHRWLIVGVILAGLVGLSLSRGIFGLLWHGTDRAYSQDYQRLLDSLGPTRPMEARISGGISHRPYLMPTPTGQTARTEPVRSTSRGEAGASEGSQYAVPPEVAIAIQRADERNPSPENRAALAVLNLVEGDPGTAVKYLRETRDQKPADPRFLNDLAAALLAISETTGDPWLVLEAIESAEHSAVLKPSLPALFNQGLALERLGLHARAIMAWRRYLDQDARSAWAQEAAQGLDRLEHETPKSRTISKLFTAPAADPAAFEGNPWASRQFGEWTLLTRWAKQTLASRQADAEAALAGAEALASSLNESGRLLAVSAAAIREAENAGDRARIERLARGHKAFGEAVLRARAEQAGVGALLDAAIADFRAADSPFALRARVLRAWRVAEPDWVELQDLESTAEQGRFPSISAEVRRIVAYRISLEGRLELAVDVYREARRRFEALGEGEASAVVAAMTSELLSLLGREQEATSELTEALRDAPGMADPWNRYSIYVAATTAAAPPPTAAPAPSRFRFSRAAVELRLEAADACRDMPERPLCAVDSWLRVAAITPDAAVAEDALKRAGDLLLKAPDSDGKARTKIDLTTARARWLAGDDRSTTEREEAADLLRQVAATYESKRLAVPAARARAMRAQVLQRLGLPEEASAEYQAGLQLFRQWDQGKKRAERRLPPEQRTVYEELLKIELDKAGNQPSPTAFRLSEEMRDRLAPRRSTELWLPDRSGIDRFATAVPAQTAVIEYAIIGKRAVAWILAGGRPDQVAFTLQDNLGQSIRSLAKERDLDSWKRDSGALFKELLAPVLDRLPRGTKRLVLIPDSDLYGLPFRALWNPDSRQYLDETLLVSFAPSVRQSLEIRKDQSVSPVPAGPLVLSLGFTSFLPQLGLEPLPQAAGEAEAVREVYGGLVSDGCQEVKDWASFRRCAKDAGVLHLATHASANSTQSEWSWLAFEQETVNLDRLWKELPDLPQHPLVVLSACQSVAAGGGEGLGGLARPFLASGARAVVGTLWKIHDKDAADLFPAFHRAFRDSGNAAEALSRSRESLENWQEKPWVWGAVEVVNGEVN